MTHTYKITGMTCSGCVSKVKSRLLMLPDVLSAEVSLPGEAVINMQKHIATAELQKAIGDKYIISDEGMSHHAMPADTTENKGLLQTYKPLLLVFAFITGISFITALHNGNMHYMMWMQYFMAGFFIVFSFFKLLDIRGFADSYSSYDLLAKRWYAYGYIYPFIELAFGIAYLLNFEPVLLNAATIIVMGFSTIGVTQSVLDKKKIRCACLGSVFNLPMSTITIVENMLMVLMAALMLFISE